MKRAILPGIAQLAIFGGVWSAFGLPYALIVFGTWVWVDLLIGSMTGRHK